MSRSHLSLIFRAGFKTGSDGIESPLFAALRSLLSQSKVSVACCDPPINFRAFSLDKIRVVRFDKIPPVFVYMQEKQRTPECHSFRP